jgi:iron complex outermembrane recepter protein
MRLTVAVAVACLIAGVSIADDASAAIKRPTNIPAQKLGAALEALAKNCDVQVVYFSGAVDALQTQGAVGELSTEEAFARVLSGTGLTYRYLDEKTITIVPLAQQPPVSPTDRNELAGGAAGATDTTAGATPGSDSGDSPRKTFWDRFRLAQAGDTTAQSEADKVSGKAENSKNSSAPSARSEGVTELDEVVVTATKRPELVRNISGSITALSGAALEEIGAQDFADYLTRVPGVVLNAQVPGLSPVVIRGVSTTTGFDQGQGTTGYFINDVPLTDPYSVIGIPDIDTFDVDNVAVLRGPQGTLFGSASLGGAVNYQAAKPNMSEYQLHVQATGEGVTSGGTGGAGKLMLNVPLISDVLAMRAVYYYRDDPGYYNNIGTGKKDSNVTLTRGGRFEATWAPTSNTTINYMFLDQTQDTADSGYQEPATAGPLQKNTVIPEPNDLTTLLHSLRLDQDLGFATLTAMATYHDKSQRLIQDETAALSGLLPGVSPIVSLQTGYSRGGDYEVRLASPSGERIEYLVGAMYDNTRELFSDTFHGANAAQVIESLFSGVFGTGIGAKGAPGGVFLNGQLPFDGREKALFGEVTYHLNDQWKATLGGRAFQTESSNRSIESGFIDELTSGALSTTLSGSQKDSGFLPKGSVTWTPNGNIMTYALVSKGFRFGGPNIAAGAGGSVVPATFGSDSLINYELGTRTTWFEQRLQLDTNIYYIDWSNIQVQLYTPFVQSYGANAGGAKNYGLESTALWRISNGLSLRTNLTYLSAKLDQDYNPGGGQPIIPSGSTLPGASKWQVSNLLSYQWFGGPWQPAFIFGQRYISTAPGAFQIGVPQGNYSLYDGRVTLHIKDVSVSAFVNNIANSHGVTSAFNSPPLEEDIVRPRTVGITLDYKL